MVSGWWLHGIQSVKVNQLHSEWPHFIKARPGTPPPALAVGFLTSGLCLSLLPPREKGCGEMLPTVC